MHLCWGNYEGPHHYDVPLADIIDLVFAARPAAPSPSRRPTRATRTSGRVFETGEGAATGKVIIPGRARLDHQLHRASRCWWPSGSPATRGWSAARTSSPGTDCGFGTWVGQAAVDPDIAWAKLASLAEGARRASRELW